MKRHDIGYMIVLMLWILFFASVLANAQNVTSYTSEMSSYPSVLLPDPGYCCSKTSGVDVCWRGRWGLYCRKHISMSCGDSATCHPCDLISICTNQQQDDE